MIWLAEWKKFLVYQIILDEKDSQARQKNYNSSMDFKIFEPDFFMKFFNTEVIKSRRDEEEALTTQVLAKWPWLIAYYWSKKQIIVGQKFRNNAKAIEIPSKDEVISCLEELNLTVTGSGDMPYLTIEVACTHHSSTTHRNRDQEICFASYCKRWRSGCYRPNISWGTSNICSRWYKEKGQ